MVELWLAWLAKRGEREANYSLRTSHSFRASRKMPPSRCLAPKAPVMQAKSWYT